MDELIEKVKQTGIDKVQLALDPLREGGNRWRDTGKKLADSGITILSGMFGTVGEDYSTIETIRRTGGVVPDVTWPATWANVRQIPPIAQSLGVELITFHAGFVPENPDEPGYATVLERVGRIADLFAAAGMKIGLETGQESAQALERFLCDLGRQNVGTNFDPANMILYGSGDPIEAVRLLAPRLWQCHIKDATRSNVPDTWGTEVVVGTGEVDWPGFFNVLNEAGYAGNFSIEREAGDSRVADIRTARENIHAVVSGR
ncbi:MAG: sugar phosphate isomerase/epimerase family protein [Phycisphaeraceae bacterium]